jgi:hypothetical protein
MKKDNNESSKFEFKTASGKSRGFNSGYDMWSWVVQNCPKTEFKFNERSGPFLTDFFEKRYQANKKNSTN